MNRSYGQYCPLALAAELLCQRWTLLVVSRLIDGCTKFNEIHRGLPRISPGLLSQRLKELESAGLVQRHRGAGPRDSRYELTASGQALEDIVMSLAVWGQHWARDMEMEDLDPAFLAWSMHLRMDIDAMPRGQVVLEFALTTEDRRVERFWLVKHDSGVDMCMKNPGLEPDLLVESDIRRFVEAWRGIRSLESELKARRINLSGPAALKRQFASWLQLSMLAPYERRRPGRECQTEPARHQR